VTVRYYFVKLIFVPIMAGFLYANIQELISMAQISVPVHYTVQGIVQTYMFAYMGLMVVDVIWFALCSMVETKRFSPIVTVDPYASGWIVSMICYPPLNSQAGQFFPWMPPNFPFEVTSPGTALIYAVLGILLWLAYVIADFSFGLKAGNLTYRGLVDKGAYRIIRHPMYTTKILAWTVFTIPALGFHIGHNAAGIPFVACNYSLLWAVIAWACIYASRAFTEERYLLTYPEYREYCTRVRYRFIPGIL